MKTKEIIIVYPDTSEQEEAIKAFVKENQIKYEVSRKEHYDPEFVERIKEGEKQIKEGKTVEIDLDNIWTE